VGARLAPAAGAPARVRVFWNDRPIGGWDVEGSWSDYELELPIEVQRAGRNFLRLRAPTVRNLAVCGLWLSPSGN
jgi:hypothetical protein